MIRESRAYLCHHPDPGASVPDPHPRVALLPLFPRPLFACPSLGRHLGVLACHRAYRPFLDPAAALVPSTSASPRDVRLYRDDLATAIDTSSYLAGPYLGHPCRRGRVHGNLAHLYLGFDPDRDRDHGLGRGAGLCRLVARFCRIRPTFGGYLGAGDASSTAPTWL